MGSFSMDLGAMDDDVTSRLPADVTMTKVTLAAGHRQMALLGYVMTSWDVVSYPAYRLMSL